MTGFMQGAKFPLPQVGANPFAPPAGYPPMPVPPPHPGPAGSQPGAAGTAQWNAMLQYYAYYSYLLCNGGMGGPAVDGGVPRVAPPPLVDVSAWRPGGAAPGGAPGMPQHAGLPGAPPGMTAAHMQSVAAMVAAMGAGQHAMAAAAAAMAAPHAGKKDGGKKEKPPADPVKEREKLEKKVIKEGGKKGVEIEGASDMGGLDFFCTTIESPEGDVDLLQMAMTAMNAQPDPEAEDRKGCSGHVGKMVFSAGTAQLAIVAYVPDGAHNKSASKVDVTAWTDSVVAAVGAKVVTPATKADSPMGGMTVTAVAVSDPEKGKFALKDKDAAMAAAFAFLRSKDAFPEDKDSDDDECAFGDDAFEEMGF